MGPTLALTPANDVRTVETALHRNRVSFLKRFDNPHKPEQHAPGARQRMAAAAGDLAVVADADALALLADLGNLPRPSDGFGPGRADTLGRLVAAGLVQSDPRPGGCVALTRRGREVWQSVRSLCQ